MQQLKTLINEVNEHKAAAKKAGAEADRLGAEADKAAMLKALSIMVFPQYKTGNDATKQAEVQQTRAFVTSFSERIVATHANREWYVIRNKSPHLTAKALDNLIKPVLADNRLPKANGLKVDLSGFTDEIDMGPAAEFIKSTANLKQITFGQLSDDQVTTLAKNVVDVVKAKGADFIKFSTPDTESKFAAALRNAAGSKPLPAVPPRPGKNPVMPIPIQTGGKREACASSRKPSKSQLRIDPFRKRKRQALACLFLT